jgi:hypothetical protein
VVYRRTPGAKIEASGLRFDWLKARLIRVVRVGLVIFGISRLESDAREI